MNLNENGKIKYYKGSRYNHFYTTNEGFLCYNSLTGLRCHIFEDNLVNQVKELQDGATIDEETIDERLVYAKIAVDTTLDEIILAQKQIADALQIHENTLRLIILPTRECNFRCVYCYEDKRTEYMKETQYEDIIQATKVYIEEHPAIKQLQIEWFGGEPLLCYDHIVYVSSELLQYCDEHGLSFNMAMTTNAYLLTKERAQKLLALHLYTYQITLDGLPQTHDTLRVLKNGSPTWNVIFQNLKDINEIESQKLQITIRINYHLGMLTTMRDFLVMLKENLDIGGKFLIYAIKITPPPHENLPIDFVTAETELMSTEFVFTLFSELGIPIDTYKPNISPCEPVCYARKNNVFIIDTDGTLRKCTEFLEDNTVNNVGKLEHGRFIVNEDIHTLWLYPNPEMLAEKKCYTCQDFPNCCGGLCPIQWLRDGMPSCNPMIPMIEDMLRIEFENETMKSENS